MLADGDGETKPYLRQSRRQMLKQAGGIGLLSLTAGCGGDGTQDGGADTPGDGGGQSPTTGEDTPSTEDGAEVKLGGTVTVAIRNDPDTIHPHKAPDVGIDLVENMCNSLFRATPEGEFVPDLAREMPEISDDGLTYTVKIREGVKFHPPYDREVTAEDVVWTWRKILDEDYGGYGRGYFVNTLVGEGIDPESSVQQTGEYKVTFNLAQVYGPFIAKQARLSGFGWFSIIPKEALEEHGEDFGTFSTGIWATGPFTYNAEESVPGSEYVMDRNPNYFREDENGNQLPYLDRIVWRPIPEDSVRTTQLQAGEIDLDPFVSPTDVEKLEGDGVSVQSTASTSHVRMWINLVSYEPTANKQVRKAMMYGMNRDAIIQTKFRGHASVAHSVIPPFHWAYDDDSLVKYPHDPDRAQDLLNQEGYSDGFTLECNPANTPVFVDTATIIQQQFAQIGIDMKVNPLEQNAMWNKFAYEEPGSDFHSAMENFIWSWSADDFTASEFHSDAAFNYTYYSNPEADELMMEARHSVDREKRKDLYAEIQKILTDDQPLLSIVWEDAIWGHRSSLKNAQVIPTQYRWCEEFWLDE